MQIVDLYSGIGGFSLAGSWILGWKTIQFCEIDKFCQKVLSYHFPGVPIHEDIKTLTSEIVKNNKLYNKDEKTIVTGGFPCQPWSLAGKRKGTEDVRNLWPETITFVKDYKPDWCLFENVYGLVNWDGGVVFEQVCADLENAGYEVQTYLLPACGVNAPHRRDRIWIVAYKESQQRGMFQFEGDNRITPNTKGSSKSGGLYSRSGEGKSGGCDCKDASHTCNQGLQGCKNEGNIEESKQNGNEQSSGCVRTDWKNFPTISPFCSGNDGIPAELDFKTVFAGIPFPRKPITFGKWRNESIKCLGNSIVPQVAYQLLKSIDNYENTKI